MALGPAEIKKFERQVTAVIADIDFYTYYQLLGVESETGASMVQYNYNIRNLQYEEVQKSPNCPHALHHNLTLLRARLDEAVEVLTDEQLKEEYDRGLELGEMRHGPTAQRNDQPTVDKARDEYLEKVTAGLEQKLGRELLHAQEEEEDPDPEEELARKQIDPEQLEALAAAMREKLAKAGIDLQVREDLVLDEESGLDPEYLESAVQHLMEKLAQHKVDLDEETEAEDQSAEAEYAADLVARLNAELVEMGIDMFDVSETDNGMPEELLDAPLLPDAPMADMPEEEHELGYPGMDGELKIDVSRYLDPSEDEVVVEDTYEGVIQLDEPDHFSAPISPLSREPARPDPHDAIPLILLRGLEEGRGE